MSSYSVKAKIINAIPLRYFFASSPYFEWLKEDGIGIYIKFEWVDKWLITFYTATMMLSGSLFRDTHDGIGDTLFSYLW